MQNLTLSPAYGASVSVPEEGELITAALSGSGRGPVRPSLQELGNRSEYVKIRADLLDDLLAAGVRARPYLACYSGSTLVVGATGPLVFPSGGGYAVGSIPAETGYTITAILDAGSLASNTWYYVYGYLSGGTVLCEISTTGPDSGKRYKSGDTSRVYFGNCRTVSAAAVVPFTSVAGVTRYANGDYGAATNMLVISTNSAPLSFTDIDLSVFKACGAVPPGARFATFGIRWINGNNTTQTFSFGGNSSNAITRSIYASGTDIWSIELPLDNSLVARYKVTLTNIAVDIDVLGYTID